jgi:hypothetical protein
MNNAVSGAFSSPNSDLQSINIGGIAVDNRQLVA